MEFRAFLAAYPSPDALERILAFRRDLRDSMPASGIRWAKEEQLHLTLQFFATFPADKVEPFVESLAEVLAPLPPVGLKAAFVGALWDRCKVLGLKVEGCGLDGLAQTIGKTVRRHGLSADGKPFRAHLTLARLDDARLQPRISKRTVAEWTADAVFLVKSELLARGANHTILAKVPLGGAATT